MPQQHDTIPASKSKPRTFLILEGGGVKGSALVGALSEVAARVTVAGVGGTSAGAILAALFAAGYTAEELRIIMLQLNYRSLAKRFLFPRRCGLHSSTPFYEWIRDLLAIKVHGGKNQQVTFSDIALPLKIVACDIRNRKLVVFSKSDHAGMDVATAVRMSMSIPFFYEYVDDGARQMVDGGAISNFPMWLFDKERQDAEAGTAVLGLDLIEPKLPATQVRGLRSFTAALVGTVLDANRTLLEQQQIGRRRTNIIRIPTGDVSATDFDISSTQVQSLYDGGVQAARLFFATQAIAGPTRVPPRRPAPAEPVALGPSPTRADYSALVTSIVSQHIYRGGVAQNAGTFDEVLVRFYVDLMEAALIPSESDVLAACAAAFLRDVDVGRIDVMAGLKMGNPLLTVATAHRIKRPALLVKDVFTPRGGYPFDGCVSAGQQVLIFDDIASDGTFLRNAVRCVRSQGARVMRVVVLVERNEGNARELLEREGCGLDSLLQLSDSDLEKLTSA
jgi:predicted acylesterase/phospholipase RssA/orotate phosphoribosyltransferase